MTAVPCPGYSFHSLFYSLLHIDSIIFYVSDIDTSILGKFIDLAPLKLQFLELSWRSLFKHTEKNIILRIIIVELYEYSNADT